MSTVTLEYNARSTKAMHLLNYLRTLDFVRVSDSRKTDNSVIFAASVADKKNAPIGVVDYKELVRDPFNLES